VRCSEGGMLWLCSLAVGALNDGVCVIGDRAVVEQRQSISGAGGAVEQLQTGLFWNCHLDPENSSGTVHSATHCQRKNNFGMSCSGTILGSR